MGAFFIFRYTAAMGRLIETFLHLDVALGGVIAQYGVWTYAILFLIIFCETGLVVTPFLPGDSLLFAAGAFAATGVLHPVPLILLLIVAAIMGDAANYMIGRKVGKKALANGKLLGLPIKKAHIEKTQAFYARYGAKTIVIARFMPIVRTLAPFVAGVGEMHYPQFVLYNVFGGILWVLLFTLGGFFFGNLPAVKENFELVILAIIGLSVLPAVIEYLKQRRAKPPGKQS
jgi:membrane-associated protein